METNETFLCDQCGAKKTGEYHVDIAGEITICGQCFADLKKSIAESRADLSKAEG